MLKLFGSPRKNNKADNQQKLVELLEDDQPYNPFTEVTIFSHHTDIIRHLLVIDNTRFASAGDDASIAIWDVKLNQKIHVLSGHTRPVTCIYLLHHQGAQTGHHQGSSHTSHQGASQTVHHLLSAASDKLICIWDIDAGHLITQLRDHQSTARCFLRLNHQPSYFCSGGEKLCLWTQDGSLSAITERGGEEDITQMLELKDNRVVLCADKRLVVYNVREAGRGEMGFQLNRKLTSHREAIKCLLKINDACFVSGSLDGSVILWSAQALAPSRYFNTIKDYMGDNRMYPYSIQALLCLDERYLVCAVGTGFCIYDIIPGRLLAEKTHAHHSKILTINLVCNKCLLVSCSEDGAIRLWGSEKTFQGAIPLTQSGHTEIERLLGLSKDDLRLLKEKEEKIEPRLLGECLGHAGPVQVCQRLEEGFLTCGADGLVIAWKDGIEQSMKQNLDLQDFYRHQLIDT